MGALSGLTTLRVGGEAPIVVAESETDVIDAVRAADRASQPVVVLGGGSNVVFADAGLDALIVLVRSRGIEVELDSCAGAWVTASAGEQWDDLVALAVDEQWSGIEALSGIPGLVGATPIQNVGAYGQEVSATIARVRAFDRQEDRVVTLAAAECEFAYRWSRFKAHPQRYVVLSVTFQLPLGSQSQPIAYAELASSLGVDVQSRPPLDAVRQSVLGLRAAKGMVLDESDHDTWSVGSFFLNPIVDANFVLPDGVSTFAQPDGSLKVSAAGLIGAAGIERGFALPGSLASVSTKHTLALTNRGGATANEVLELARTIRQIVHSRFSITLEPEPNFIGCAL